MSGALKETKAPGSAAPSIRSLVRWLAAGLFVALVLTSLDGGLLGQAGRSLSVVLAQGSPPPNDTVGSATVAPSTSPGSASGYSASGVDNSAATEAGEPQPSCGNVVKTVWYQWTADRSDQFRADTQGSNFDTVLAVYTGALSGTIPATNPTEIACNDNDPLISGSVESRLTFNATQGTTYFFQVGGRNGATNNTGTISFNLMLAPSESQPASSNNTLTSSETEVVVTASSPSIVNITATQNVTDAKLNVQSTLTEQGGTATAVISPTVNAQLQVTLATPSGSNPTPFTAELNLQPNTAVSGPSSFTGLINLPSVTVNTGSQFAIEIGFGDVRLELSKAARIVVPRKGSGAVQVVSRQAGVETPIPQCLADPRTASIGFDLSSEPTATAALDATNPAIDDCYVIEGNQIAIWTEHFTEFAVAGTSTTTGTPGGGGGSSGGGGGSNPCDPTCNGPAPTPLVTAPTGTSVVTVIPITTVPSGVPSINSTLGGLLVQIPASTTGGVASVTTSSSSPAYLTALVPARSTPIIVRLQPQLATSLPVPPGLGTTVTRAFSLDVFATNGTPLRKHDAPVTLAVQVTSQMLAQVGGDPRRLVILFYDGTTGLWYRLPTTYNAAKQTVEAQTFQTDTFAVGQIPAELTTVSVKRQLPFVPVNPVPALQAYLPYVAKDVDQWTSGFQIQATDAAATFTISYYDRTGRMVGSQTDTVAGGTSKTYFGGSLGVAAPFAGSATVVSDQPIAVIVNELTLVPPRADSYVGIAVPMAVQFLPLIMRNNSGFNTEIFVQNAASSGQAASVKLEYYQGSSLVRTDQLPPLAAGASAWIRQVEQLELGERWVGSVKVISDQPVAAVVNQVHPSQLLAYSGFVGGTSRVSIPLVMNDNSGWFTGLQVQNVGAAAVPVTLRVNGQVAAQATIAPGGSQSWYPVPGTDPDSSGRFVGAATIEGPAGSQLVAIVNQVHPESGQATTYRGFSGGSSVVSAPLIMNDNSGFSTGLQVQNAGSEPTTVRLVVNGTVQATVTLAAGASQNWYPLPGTEPGFVGSALVQGDPGSQLVGIVNEVQTRPDAPGENALAYEAVNQ
ncbi:MAG: hypothetical protein HY329_23270 [Chloroflexi bacterium]|nr:hypothetical protein [Chloroflexota bacterium]